MTLKIGSAAAKEPSRKDAKAPRRREDHSFLPCGLALLALFALLAGLAARPATAQSPAALAFTNPVLDPTFGDGGIARYALTGFVSYSISSSQAYAMPDGGALVALGFGYFVDRSNKGEGDRVVRFGPDGAWLGERSWYGYGRVVAVQSGGRVLFAGSGYTSVSSVQRYLPDFSPDPAFAFAGPDQELAYDYDTFLVQPDDRIVVGSYSDGTVRRHLADGALDNSFPTLGPFAGFGWPSGGFSGLAGVPDGRFLVLTETGCPDGTCAADLYSPDGAPLAQVYSAPRCTNECPCAWWPGQIASHPDGGFVWVKFIGPYFRLYKSLPPGGIDPSFGKDGVALFGLPLNLEQEPVTNLLPVVQPDGRILMAGMVREKDAAKNHLMLVRYHPDGTPDETLGAGGRRYFDLPFSLSTVLLQPDGKLLLVGHDSQSLFLARLLPLADSHPVYFPLIGGVNY